MRNTLAQVTKIARKINFIKDLCYVKTMFRQRDHVRRAVYGPKYFISQEIRINLPLVRRETIYMNLKRVGRRTKGINMKIHNPKLTLIWSQRGF